MELGNVMSDQSRSPREGRSRSPPRSPGMAGSPHELLSQRLWLTIKGKSEATEDDLAEVEDEQILKAILDKRVHPNFHNAKMTIPPFHPRK